MGLGILSGLSGSNVGTLLEDESVVEMRHLHGLPSSGTETLAAEVGDGMIAWIHYTTETVASVFYEAHHGYWPYGDPPRYDLYFSALVLLSLIATDDTPRPDVCPMSKGGVQLEWHVNGFDLELYVEDTDVLGVGYQRGDHHNLDYKVFGGPRQWAINEGLRRYVKALETER